MWLGWLSLCLSCVCAVSTQSVPVVWGKLRPVGGKLNLRQLPHDNFSNNWPRGRDFDLSPRHSPTTQGLSLWCFNIVIKCRMIKSQANIATRHDILVYFFQANVVGNVAHIFANGKLYHLPDSRPDTGSGQASATGNGLDAAPRQRPRQQLDGHGGASTSRKLDSQGSTSHAGQASRRRPMDAG